MKLSYAKDVFYSFGIQIFENGKSFLLIPVIAKTLGASGYGIWIQVKIGIAFLCPFILLGMGGGITRYLPGSTKRKISEGMFSSILITLTNGILLAILIISLGGVLQRYIGLNSSSGLFIKGLAVLCIAEPLNNLYLEYFRAFRRIKTILSFSIFDTCFEFLPVFWFVYNGFGIDVVIFTFACSRILIAAVKGLLISREIGIGSFNMGVIVGYVKFGLPLIWASTFFYITNYIDRYLIGLFHSAKEVGIYSFAYSIGYIVVLISAPWERVLVPTITTNWNEGRYNEVKEYFEITMRYMLLTMIPLIIFVSILGEKIITLLSTSEFMDSRYIIPIMLISSFFFQGGVYCSSIIKLAFKSAPGLIMKVFFLLAVVSLFLNIVLIPRFSIFGAAATMAFVYFLMFTIFSRIVKKIINVRRISPFLIKSIIATIPGCAVLLFFNNVRIAGLAINILAAILLYVITLWMTGVIGRKEYRFLTKVFNIRKTIKTDNAETGSFNSR